jgi:hypothetical protein
MFGTTKVENWGDHVGAIVVSFAIGQGASIAGSLAKTEGLTQGRKCRKNDRKFAEVEGKFPIGTLEKERFGDSIHWGRSRGKNFQSGGQKARPSWENLGTKS